MFFLKSDTVERVIRHNLIFFTESTVKYSGHWKIIYIERAYVNSIYHSNIYTNVPNNPWRVKNLQNVNTVEDRFLTTTT